MQALIFGALAATVHGHGSMLIPESVRNHNRSIENGGICNQNGGVLSDSCIWFSNEAGPIPGPPTLIDPELRTMFQEYVPGSEQDIFRFNPCT